MVARFFANYPNSDTCDLSAFQTELKYYIQEALSDNDNGGNEDVEYAS